MQGQGLPQNTTYTVGALFSRPRKVWSEEEIRIRASEELHTAVEDVLNILGIRGEFRVPGGGNRALIGAPDFSWVSTGEGHPKLVTEYKTEWVSMLQDLRRTFANKYFRTRDEKQSLEAVEHIYGYMAFNELRYGILSNWTNTWALRRIETNGRKTLQCAGPFTIASQPSILKVFVGMVLLAETDWFYASPTTNLPSPSCFFTSSALQEQKKSIRQAGMYRVEPRNQTYPLLCGLYSVWGILHVLALEPVGEPIQSRQLTQCLRQKMKAALKQIHQAGYVYGDISLAKFCESEDGTVFIVDLENCRRSADKSEMDAEESIIDLL